MDGSITLKVKYTMRGTVCKSTCPYFRDTEGWFCEIFGVLAYVQGRAPLPARHPKCIEADTNQRTEPLTGPSTWERISEEE